MRFTGLAITAPLAVCVSGAVVFRNAAGLPIKKRQGVLEGLWPSDVETTITTLPVHLLTTTGIVVPTPLTSHDSTTATRVLFPGPGDVLFSPGTSPTTSSSSASSTVSYTFTSSPSQTHTLSSLTEPAVAVSTPSRASTFLSPAHPSSSDTTPRKPTATPSSPSTAVPASATSTTSTWKTVGISVSVVTTIGITILLVVFYEQWTAFVRDVFLCHRSRRDQDPLGDEDFLPDKHYENYDATIRSYSQKWAREIRESARLSNIRYPTDVFYGNGSALGPGKAGVGAGGRVFGVGEFGQLGRPSRPSFLQRFSILSPRASSPVSPRLGTKNHTPSGGKAGDGFATSTLSPPKMSTF